MSLSSTPEAYCCRRCGEQLEESNTTPSVWRGLCSTPPSRSYTCKICARVASKENFYAKYEKKRLAQKEYYNSHKERWSPSERRQNYMKWVRGYTYDWLYLQLGNKCVWCGRTPHQCKLEVDHVLPVIRNEFRFGSGPLFLMKEFLNGEELRLLCEQCHAIRHAL